MNQQNDNNENWGKGLMILSSLILCFHPPAWLAVPSIIALVIGLFRWLWYEADF